PAGRSSLVGEVEGLAAAVFVLGADNVLVVDLHGGDKAVEVDGLWKAEGGPAIECPALPLSGGPGCERVDEGMDGGGFAGERLCRRNLLASQDGVIEEAGTFDAQALAELLELGACLDGRIEGLRAARVLFLEVEQAVGGNGEGVLAVDGT